MRIRLSLFCTALMVLLSANIADAQLTPLPADCCPDQGGMGGFHGDLLHPGIGFPGRLWVESNIADRGLGFSDSYLTVGGKSRLFQDGFDGRWLAEGQLHASLSDDVGFFTNMGISRVFTIAPAQADVALGVFYDYDGDDQQSFSNGFHQFGLSGSIKTPKWDLFGNGYIPVGTTD